MEDGVEYLKQKGLVGAARDAADEVLARVGEAKAAVLHAPAVLLQKVRPGLGRALAVGQGGGPAQAGRVVAAIPVLHTFAFLCRPVHKLPSR